jgi:hypothetical protein
MMNLLGLCQRFGVSMAIESDAYAKDYMVVIFGPVRHSIPIGEGITDRDFYEISLKLAATFPNKVLGDIYGQ